MDRNELAKELEKIEKVFKNKNLIDFYDAKLYITGKLKINIQDDLIEKFLIDKGYKNITKRKNVQTFSSDNITFELGDSIDLNLEVEQEEPQEINIDEDFDIDGIMDMDFTPNVNKNTLVNIGNSWIRYSERKNQCNFSENTGLIKEYQRTRNPEVLDVLVEINTRLVTKYAIRHSKYLSGYGLTIEDLIQEGCIGVIKAVERFDTSKGYEFSTYALWWIRQAINRAIYNQDNIIRLPIHMIETLMKLRKLELDQVRIYGEIIPEETCKSLGVTMERYMEYKKYEYQYGTIVSLDRAIGSEEDSELIEFVGEKNIEGLFGINKEYTDPADQYDEIELSNAIKCVLKTLNQKESTIIKYRFGLIDGKTHTLEEVGNIYNVSRERIRQIEAKAIRKLRHPSRSNPLKSFTGKFKFSNRKNHKENKIVKLETKKFIQKEAAQVDTSNDTSKKLISKNKNEIFDEKKEILWMRQDLKKIKSSKKKTSTEQLSPLDSKLKDQFKKIDIASLNVEKTINFLTKQGFKMIDNRSKRGALWIVGGKELDYFFKDIAIIGINFRFTEKGGKATGHKPGWYLR